METMIKPKNGWVFLKRLPIDKQFGDIYISEKACIKNYIAVCAFSEDDKFVGKKVHVPHFGVEDVLINGVEYAMCKKERIFAVMENEQLVPTNGYVKVRKCENDHIRDESGAIRLFMTDKHIEFTYWVEVLKVAEDCKYMKSEYEGMFCIAPENDELLARIGYTKDFCLHESKIEFLTNGD